jgi:hypothetical protein
MLLGIDVAGLVFAEPLIVRSRGRPVTTFACRTGLTVSDSGNTPRGEVVFHLGYADVTFEGDEEPVTLFVYVDDVNVALITVKGRVKLLVPLDGRKHHKIVTGRSLDGEANAVWAACN